MLPRYLLIEDDDSHAELICRAFEDRAEILHAPDLATARRILAAPDQAVELVMTDLRLPDGLGVDLLETHPDVPAVIMTSQGDERDAVSAIKRGAYDYIVKSVVAFEEMPRTADRVLREWRHAQEQEALKRALAERERLAAVGSAAAMLAHEIGNPLNSMSLSAQLVERRLKKLNDDTTDIAEVIATCRREIARLGNLLNEFRGLARESDLALTPIPLRTLVDEALATQREALTEAGIELRVALPEEPILALANQAKMTQVLVNLCKNAQEAMPEGGQVVIEARKSSADAVELTVTDNGPGLPPGVDVFAPLTTTKEHGSGLGLAVVAQILASHGGSATGANAPDGGARFTLRLPRVIREA